MTYDDMDCMVHWGIGLVYIEGFHFQDNLGKTALHWAASGGLGEACKAILRSLAWPWLPPWFCSLTLHPFLGCLLEYFLLPIYHDLMSTRMPCTQGHPDFRSEDAVDYRGITAYEDAEGAGQMQAAWSGVSAKSARTHCTSRWAVRPCYASVLLLVLGKERRINIK